nr:MAG TPA: hypothetical protein [Caudoviricetes sp.]
MAPEPLNSFKYFLYAKTLCHFQNYLVNAVASAGSHLQQIFGSDSHECVKEAM